MPKFKVVSGDFQVVLIEETPQKAADLAIQLHNESRHPSILGKLTLIQRLNRNSRPTKDCLFVPTQILLDANTSTGQYSVLENFNE